MNLPAQPIPVPLRMDEHGAARVGESQVLLDVLIHAFLSGETPDAIVRAYPTLQLADVYAVIAYYLRSKEEVDGYLRAREAEAERLRQDVEDGLPGAAELRAKLLARKAARGQEPAAPRG
jgi:uncharacterized protein (DUF433 family)